MSVRERIKEAKRKQKTKQHQQNNESIQSSKIVPSINTFLNNDSIKCDTPEPLSEQKINQILEYCRKEFLLECGELGDLQLCDLEDCRLWKTNHCKEWKQWVIDDEKIDEVFS